MGETKIDYGKIRSAAQNLVDLLEPVTGEKVSEEPQTSIMSFIQEHGCNARVTSMVKYSMIPFAVSDMTIEDFVNKVPTEVALTIPNAGMKTIDDLRKLFNENGIIWK